MEPKAGELYYGKLVWFVTRKGFVFSKRSADSYTTYIDIFDKDKNCWCYYAKMNKGYLQQFKEWME